MILIASFINLNFYELIVLQDFKKIQSCLQVLGKLKIIL